MDRRKAVVAFYLCGHVSSSKLLFSLVRIIAYRPDRHNLPCLADPQKPTWRVAYAQAPKPRSLRVPENTIDILTVTDGKIMEHWAVGDMLSLMQQLGVVPA
jgi:hypothetical protein